MPWVKVDDHFAEHPKHAAVGPVGWGVWLAGLAYCNRQLTDGFIPAAVAETIGGKWRVLAPAATKVEQEWTISRTNGVGSENIDADWVIALLVGVGLWSRVAGGYMVHDYPDYQPSKAEVLADRARKAAAGRLGGLARGRSPERPPEARRLAHRLAETQAESKPVPVPVPDPDPSGKQPDHVGTTRPVGATGPLVLVGDDGAGQRQDPIPADPLRPAVERIFAHWCAVLGHPQSKLSRDRAGRIRARLAEGGTEEECLRAIDGCAASPWHRGDNEHGRVYDAVDLIFRSRAKLEQFHERLASAQARAAAALANPPPPPDPRVDPTVPCCQCGQPVGGSWARTDRGPAHSGACRDAVVRAGVEQVVEPAGAGG